MPTYEIDTDSVAGVKRGVNLLKADHITTRVVEVLSDYYENTEVEIDHEIELHANLASAIELAVSELG